MRMNRSSNSLGCLAMAAVNVTPLETSRRTAWRAFRTTPLSVWSGEHLEAFDDGHAGFDHDPEVAGQHDDVVGADPGREPRDGDVPPKCRALDA